MPTVSMLQTHLDRQKQTHEVCRFQRCKARQQAQHDAPYREQSAPGGDADEEAIEVGQVVHVNVRDFSGLGRRVHLLQHLLRQRLRDLREQKNGVSEPQMQVPASQIQKSTVCVQHLPTGTALGTCTGIPVGFFGNGGGGASSGSNASRRMCSLYDLRVSGVCTMGCGALLSSLEQ